VTRILLKGGRVIDPSQDMDATCDVLVADGPFSVILDQVTNGVAVRMAVLYLLSGGKASLADAAKAGAAE
jgi:aspartate carbamoyltransferase catalytic subunit